MKEGGQSDGMQEEVGVWESQPPSNRESAPERCVACCLFLLLCAVGRSNTVGRSLFAFYTGCLTAEKNREPHCHCPQVIAKCKS